MDDGTLRRLRAEATRADYPSMARLAQALYDNGLTTREVLHECYGVDFPIEFFVLAEADPWELGLLVTCTDQPWRLAVPPDEGGPQPAADPSGPTERRLLAFDPDLLPLMYLLGSDSVPWDNQFVLCYRLSELRANRSTVYRLRQQTTRPGKVRRLGDSLLSVLHEYHAKHVRDIEREQDDPDNWGAGAVPDEEVDAFRALVERIEALQHEVAAREGR
ncbi:hypothetical protein [Amycolatopsis eburnea]|uniref:Uncharacterized protein n=1 Tax=Amycolatopsis eburnea TaxID=2267691 RepID=A0A427SVD5_9PSEU|nr:hypothetical protein [Amycolatopsis eburnea]RSD07785.1 hypothetical protein EIY87_44125 [Amycolatopsis eburnea]